MTPALIFLDIDGVLNTHDYYLKALDFSPSIDRHLAENLNRICLAFDVSFCISSSWRRYILSQQISYRAFSWCLSTHGIRGRVIGATGGDPARANSPGQRLEQINQFLEWSKWEGGKWIVIDDMAIPTLGERLIQPDTHTGLSAADADHAISTLEQLQ